MTMLYHHAFRLPSAQTPEEDARAAQRHLDRLLEEEAQSQFELAGPQLAASLKRAEILERALAHSERSTGRPRRGRPDPIRQEPDDVSSKLRRRLADKRATLRHLRRFLDQELTARLTEPGPPVSNCAARAKGAAMLIAASRQRARNLENAYRLCSSLLHEELAQAQSRPGPTHLGSRHRRGTDSR